MTRMMPFLPLFLALSTSSPFWQARRTGLMGYRLAAYDELPRTGLPDLFEDQADYDRFISIMTETRAIQDSSYIWWAIRPSLKFPTLELRVADSCTTVGDAVRLAMLYRSLVRHLERNPIVNAGLTAASRAIAQENKWRAQRYGIHGSFIDEARRMLISVPEFLHGVIAMVAEDAEALGCARHLASMDDILRRGTSADRQIAVFTDRIGQGQSREEALGGVIEWLAAESGGQQAPMTQH
jgi:glutamate---cysteine ligase / carboxylate-amine ligase